MISFICGQVADTTENSVIIETGGNSPASMSDAKILFRDRV